MAVIGQILLLSTAVVVNCQSPSGNQEHFIQDNVNPLQNIIEKFRANNELITKSVKEASEGLLDINLKPLDFSGSKLLGFGWLSHDRSIGQISDIEKESKYNKNRNYVQDIFGNIPLDSSSEKGSLSISKSTMPLELNDRQPIDKVNPSIELENNYKYYPMSGQRLAPNISRKSLDQNKQSEENLDFDKQLSALPINFYVNGEDEKKIQGKFNPIKNVDQPNLAKGVEVQQKSPLKLHIKDHDETNNKNNQSSYDENTRVSNGLKLESMEDKTKEPIPKSTASNFNSDNIFVGILVIDPELKATTSNNNSNIVIKKNKDAIVFPNEIREINVDNKIVQPFESQPSNIHNRLGNGSNQYFTDKTEPPKSTSSNVAALATSSPTEGMISNIPPNRPISSNAQWYPQSKLNFQDTANQNRYSGNQGVAVQVNDQGPNSQMPLNNVLSEENISPSSNVVMTDANNGMPIGYIPVSTSDDRNSGNNINYPSFVINNRPVSSLGQTINGGYYNDRNSPQQYYILQLGNGQTILVPVSIDQSPRQTNERPGNNVQSNVQNNVQYQYVPVNDQNIFQVPVNNQPIVQLPAWVIQMPSNGQVMYQVNGPNNPQLNAMTYSVPVKIMPVGALNGNTEPMVISYKDKEVNIKPGGKN